LTWYSLYKLKDSIKSIVKADANQNDLSNFYQKFISEVKNILGSKYSIAGVIMAVSIIMSTIDSFDLEENVKNDFKKEVYQIQEQYKQNLNTNTLEESLPADKQVEEQKNQTIDERFDFVKDQIKQHEGVGSSAYLDSVDVPTIGVGLNLKSPMADLLIPLLDINNKGVGVVTVKDLIEDATSDNKQYTLTDEQVDYLFNYCLETAYRDANKFLPNLESYPENIQKTVLDMSFNLGYSRLSKFKKLRQNLIKKDYDSAAKEMINSDWYSQVGDRGRNLVNIIQQ